MMNKITRNFGYMPVEFRRVWSERSDSRIHSVLLPVDSYGVFHRHDNSQDHVKG